MSTIIKLIPQAHATKRTTWVRLTDDGQFTTRVEDPIGTDTDKSFNFSSLVEGQRYDIANEPFIEIEAQKIGTHARYIACITEFYDPALDARYEAPVERFIWYDYKTKSDEAPDNEAVQTFPINVLFSTSGTPQSPTRALSSVVQTPQRLYQRLGTTAARREHLKGNIRAYIDNPEFPLWMARSESYPLINAHLHVITDRRIQSFLWYLEMITRAISDDQNLNTEAKFNLLNGMTTLDGPLLIKRIDYIILEWTNPQHNVPPALTTDRSTWTFRRLGSVAATTPFAYTEPVVNNRANGVVVATGTVETWTAVEDTSIRMTHVDVGTSWYNYLRT